MTWRLLNYRPYGAFENMAIDEAIFRETIKNKKPPTLRFFGWQRPAVSIGYFQELKSEIHFDRCRLSGIDIVRRMTGGKAVYHKDEVTYSVAAGNSGKLFPDSITGTYEKISLCLARGLAELGIRADLAQTDTEASGRKPWTTSCCFSEPVGRELLVAGRKICGSAQVRTHGSFLQHGSMLMTFDPVETAALILMPPEPHNMEKFERSVTAVNQEIPVSVSAEILCRVLREGFVKELGIDLSEEPLTPAEEALSGQLVEKYESDAWNWERKKEAFKLG